MTIVQSDPQTKGRYTKFAHALLVCTALLKLCGLIYIIVGSLLKIRDGVFNTYTFPLLNQFVIHGMPLGDLSWGLVVALYFFLPLHTLFGFLGFFGAICRNKLLLIIHTCLLLFGIALDTVFIVLFSLILEGINTWIKWRFIDFYEDYSSTPTRLNTEVYNAFNHMFDAVQQHLYTANFLRRILEVVFNDATKL